MVASVLRYTPEVILEAHPQFGEAQPRVVHPQVSKWKRTILLLGWFHVYNVNWLLQHVLTIYEQAMRSTPLVVLGAQSLTPPCPPPFFPVKEAYRATGRLRIYHWPENSSVCDQGSWPCATLNGRLMGNRSRPDRLWGALLSFPPPVIHHISSWYWEILVPHWKGEKTKEGCSCLLT